jgi:hypothetical protein
VKKKSVAPQEHSWPDGVNPWSEAAQPGLRALIVETRMVRARELEAKEKGAGNRYLAAFHQPPAFDP